MAKKDWPLPAAFDPHGETVKPLAQAKARLSKSFRWSRAQSLFDAVEFAVLLHVFRRDDEALEVCRALGQVQFDGTYTRWSAVELALVLQARLLRQRGETAEADECLRRVREAGFVAERLKGRLLDSRDSLGEAAKAEARREQEARIRRAEELAFIIELGGSDECPVGLMEREWAENLDRLRVLTGAG